MNLVRNGSISSPLLIEIFLILKNDNLEKYLYLSYFMKHTKVWGISLKSSNALELNEICNSWWSKVLRYQY